MNLTAESIEHLSELTNNKTNTGKKSMVQLDNLRNQDLTHGILYKAVQNALYTP